MSELSMSMFATQTDYYEARIKELESQKLSERVTDEQIKNLLDRMAYGHDDQFNVDAEIMRGWLKEMER